MRFSNLTVISLLAISNSFANAFVPNQQYGRNALHVVRSAVVLEEKATETSTDGDTLSNIDISNLRYREVQRELERLNLDSTGTLSTMRSRLRDAVGSPASEIHSNTSDEVETTNADQLNKVSKKCCPSERESTILMIASNEEFLVFCRLSK